MPYCLRCVLLFLSSEAKLRKFIGKNKTVNTLFLFQTNTGANWKASMNKETKILKFTFTIEANEEEKEEAHLPNACNYREINSNTFLQRKTKDMKGENH